jgi:hypothetical protein
MQGVAARWMTERRPQDEVLLEELGVGEFDRR